jgi:hypothetical protein
MPVWVTKEFGLGMSREKIYSSACSLLRNGLHKIYPKWIRFRSATLKQTIKELQEIKNGIKTKRYAALKLIYGCDYIVAGHDGALDEFVCHILEAFRELGYEYGIFGVQLRSKFRSTPLLNIHYSTLKNSRFLYCRNIETVESCKINFPTIKMNLAPDPAFGMLPAEEKMVDQIIQDEQLADFFEKPVVMCSSCEPAPIARAFEHISMPDQKLIEHRKMFSALISYIVNTYDVNILFLPHALGPGISLDDRIIARDILKFSGVPDTRARLLDRDMGARELKALIGRAELLLAERLHSIIGAIGVNTPFMCMASKNDQRISGILVEMLGAGDNIYYLNNPSKKGMIDAFDSIWEKRSTFKKYLFQKYEALYNELKAAAGLIRPVIDEKIKNTEKI